MTSQSRKILADMQVRKSSREKREFRAWLTKELESAGWTVQEEYGFPAGHNVIAGDPEKAKVLYTAHYDTQAVLPFPNFITPRNMGIYLWVQLLICLGFFAIVAVVEGIVLYVAKTMEAVVDLWWLGPQVSVVLCAFLIWWMFFGKANKHTANDNTSGVITLLETALALPVEDRDKVCFVFFDNEERGMLGSSHFTGKRKRVKKNTLVLNFDCVSDGDSIQFFPTKALRKDEEALKAIEAAFLPTAGKEVEVYRPGGTYPSDNVSFKRACGVCALKKKKFYYMDRIHTSKDTVFMEENIALLREGCLRLAKGLEA